MSECHKCKQYVNLHEAWFLKGKPVHLKCEDV